MTTTGITAMTSLKRPHVLSARTLTVALLVLGLLVACGGDTHKPPPRTKRHATSAKTEAPKAPKTTKNVKWDMMKDYFFSYADTPLPSVKNPFWSNLDRYMPQVEMPVIVENDDEMVETEIKPIEKFPPEDYKLIMIISGTAVPKAIMVDPDGGRHVVRKENRVGNRNGVIDEITEFEVIVKEPFEEIDTILSIRPEYADWAKNFAFEEP
jgi:Tfp pilus assembly protein PilP